MAVSPKLIMLALGGTLVYLAMAVFGAGGFTAFFSHPARTALAVILFVLAVASLFSGGNLLAALMLVPLIGRIRSEERLLGEQFGAEYQDYRTHTWRLVPGLY